MASEMFPPDQVLALDCSRMQRPHGWDLLGRSVWDTNAGGLEPPLQTIGPVGIELRDTWQPIFALRGPTLDRFHLVLTALDRATGTGATPVVRYQVRVGAGCVTMATVEGRILAAPPAPARGSLVQIGARTCDRWEFWARVDPADGGTTGVRARFRCVLDRVGQDGMPTTTLVGTVPLAGVAVVPNVEVTTITLVE
jgi:hypothetical protein